MSLASPTSDPILAERAAARPEARPGPVRLFLQLTKARLSMLVLLTTAVGFLVASTAGADWATLAWTLIGTALAAACANALNQVIEVRRDARMLRTRGRPLPSGAMSAGPATTLAIGMGIAGLLVLAMLVNQLAAALALTTIVLYVGVYTPLKVRSTFNTLVGASCGGIPPMIGWAGATGTLDAGAWWLGAVLFVWQLPHFLALAWLYRRDYERGGFMMLPALDPRGFLCARVVVLTSLALLPLTALGVLLGLGGWLYATGAAALGLWMLQRSACMYRDRSDASARGVFLTSIAYLPILLLLLVIDRGPVTQPVPMMLAADTPAALTPPMRSSATRP